MKPCETDANLMCGLDLAGPKQEETLAVPLSTGAPVRPRTYLNSTRTLPPKAQIVEDLPEGARSSNGLNSNKGTKCYIEIRAARTFAGGVASAVYEPVGSTPSPPHSLSGGMIALNHPDRSVR